MFDHLDDSVPDDPNFLPDGVYYCIVSKAEVAPKKSDENKKQLVIDYKILDGEFAGQNIREWRSCNKDDEQADKSRLKQRLMQLGVPKDRIQTTKPGDLEAIKCYVVVANKGEFRNVMRVSLDQGNPFDASATPVAAATPGAIDF